MFLSNIFFLIASTFFFQYTSPAKQIRGTPEVDYPTYFVIPKTTFRCSDQQFNPGFYADTETRCQVFHYCYEHRQESFLCPVGTIFNQPILACDYWYSSNCSLASSYYQVNAEKRNEDAFDQADYPQHSQSENLFDKMSHLYEINNEKPVSSILKNEYDVPENELQNKEGIESSGKLFNENNENDYNKYSYDNKLNLGYEKYPEVVKYEANGLNVYEGSESLQHYETDNVKLDHDFVLSTDGMLHPSREDVPQMLPSDINFGQGFGEYAEIPSSQSFEYAENDFQVPNFELYKRYSDMNGGYVRRPSRRKPIIIPEEPEPEPEIVQLPALKSKRKPIVVALNTNMGSESIYDSNVFEEPAVSIALEDFDSMASGELPADELSLNLNDYGSFKDSNLFYESQEKVDTENSTPIYEKDSSTAIYGSSNEKKIRNSYVFSNIVDDEITANGFESGSSDPISILNVKDNSMLAHSTFGDESTEMLIDNTEGIIVDDFFVLPGEISHEVTENGSAFDIDPAVESTSEEKKVQHNPKDGSGFAEDQTIFSDGDDEKMTDIDSPNLSDVFEGSGILTQEIRSMADTEEIDNQFVLDDYSEDDIEYGSEASSSVEASGMLSPLEGLEKDGAEPMPDGSGESSEIAYFLPSEYVDNLQDVSEESFSEIREIDGSHYYILSDSKYSSNYEYDDLGEVQKENSVDENFYDQSLNGTLEDGRDVDNTLQYFPVDLQQMVDVGDIEQILDDQDSNNLGETHENLNDFQPEASSDAPEILYTDDESEKEDIFKELSAEDLIFLEVMSQTPVPIVKNLFDVSIDKASSDGSKDEIHSVETEARDNDSKDEAVTIEDSSSLEDAYEFKKISGTGHSTYSEDSIIPSEISDNMNDPEKVSIADGFGQDGSVVIENEQNSDVFVSPEETNLFNGDKTVEDNRNDKKLSFKLSSIVPQTSAEKSGINKGLAKVAGGKRANKNLRMFNPQNKGYMLRTPRTETFREAFFTSIPSAFFKMKHSTLRPTFYNLGLKDSEFLPRKGDPFESSRLSKLNSFGKRLLAAKQSKFNIVKKYVDSYRN